MARTWNEYRDSLIVLLLKVTAFLGVSNHLYDPVKQQLVYSPKAYIYRVLLRLVSLIVCVINYKQLLSNIVSLVSDRPFLSKLSSAYMYLNMAVVASAMTSVWRSCGRGTVPFNELLGMRVADSISAEELASIRRQTWSLFFLKSVLVMLIGSTTVLTLSTHWQGNAASTASFVGMLILHIEIFAFYQQFSLGMLYGGYLFKALNLRLSRVVKELNRSLYLSRRKSRRLRKELTRIGAWHTRLLNQMIAIKDIDQLHMLIILLSACFYQVSAVFYLSLMFRGMFGAVSISAIFYSTGFTLISGIDLLVGMHFCGECVKACDASGTILKGLTSFLVVDSSLGRDIDLLSFQLAREKLRLTLFRMFDLDANTGPGLFKGIMMNIILLAQMSYNEVH